jgi:hypothetical protein
MAPNRLGHRTANMTLQYMGYHTEGTANREFTWLGKLLRFRLATYVTYPPRL